MNLSAYAHLPRQHGRCKDLGVSVPGLGRAVLGAQVCAVMSPHRGEDGLHSEHSTNIRMSQWPENGFVQSQLWKKEEEKFLLKLFFL